MPDLRRRPVASLVWHVLVPVVLAGLAVSVVALALSPGAGVGALVATMVVAMLVSTLVLLQAAMAMLPPKQSPLALGMALALYASHAGVLFVLAMNRESLNFDAAWFGWTVVGLTFVWIALHVRSVTRARVSPGSRV